MKYLITGGAGFIGSNFIHYLLENFPDAEIINVDCLTYAGNPQNLSDVEKDQRYIFFKENVGSRRNLTTIFKKQAPDYVVNFAAESHVDRSIHDAEIFVKSNVMGVQNLLQLSLDFGVKKYLQVSTDEVYGSLGKTGHFSENSPLDPRSPYSASKAGGDLLTRAYFHTYNLPVNITRCSNNYGPFQFPEKLIPMAILHCLERKPIPIYGDGLNIRDWIHVSDHCSAIDKVLHRGTPGEIYNVGASNEHSNIEVVTLIIRLMNDLRPDLPVSEKLIAHVEDRRGHDRRYAIDSTKLRKTLGWKPEIPFSKGLKDTISWYLDHSGWWDHPGAG